MNFLETLKVAILALKTNKIRSFLTMLGVIIGVAAVILLVSIGSGLKIYVTKQFESLGANLIIVLPGKIKIAPRGGQSEGFPGGTSKLTLADARRIEREATKITAALPLVQTNTTVKFGNKSLSSILIIGTSEDYSLIRNFPLDSGVFFSASQVSGGKRVAIIGKKVEEDLFGANDPLGEKIILGEERYKVIGVFSKKGAFAGVDLDNQITIPITAAQKQFGIENLNLIYVQAKTTEIVPATISEIEKILGKRLKEDEFTVMDPKEILSTMGSILSVLTLALSGIAAISLLVGGIGIMNIMLVSVTQRTSEIGLRKAVGATPAAILSQFLIEAVILSAGGGIIGILLGILGSFALHQIVPAALSLWSILLAFGVSTVVGIIFGVAPALRAAKLNPIDALRWE